MPTPEVWAQHLDTKLVEQRDHARFYDEYYSGTRRMQLVEKLYLEVFGGQLGEALMQPPAINIAAVGPDAAAERMEIDRFSVGADDNAQGASDARAIFLGNDLDVMQVIAHTESLVKGTAALLVWPGADGEPIISVEDAEQFIVHRQSAPPYDIDAAFKAWVDEWTGQERGLLWLPEGRYELQKTAREKMPAAAPMVTTQGEPEWTRIDGAFTMSPVKGVVTVAELANRARLLRPPQSDLKNVAPLADAHTLLMADMIVAADTGAFPIRTATGIKLERNPVTGAVIPPFDVHVDKGMVSENPEAKFGSLPPADLAGYVAALDMVLRLLRTVTRVPQHYFGEGSSANTSGETLKAAEASLVRRVNGLTKTYGAGWRRAMSFALAIQDGATYGNAPVLTRWANTETRIETQEVDSASKAHELGVPLEIVLEQHLRYPKPLVERVMKLVREESLAAGELLDRLRTQADSVPVIDRPAPVAA